MPQNIIAYIWAQKNGPEQTALNSSRVEAMDEIGS
jgi:hypothetical protein